MELQRVRKHVSPWKHKEKQQICTSERSKRLRLNIFASYCSSDCCWSMDEAEEPQRGLCHLHFNSLKLRQEVLGKVCEQFLIFLHKYKLKHHQIFKLVLKGPLHAVSHQQCLLHAALLKQSSVFPAHSLICKQINSCLLKQKVRTACFFTSVFSCFLGLNCFELLSPSFLHITLHCLDPCFSRNSVTFSSGCATNRF